MYVMYVYNMYRFYFIFINVFKFFSFFFGRFLLYLFEGKDNEKKGSGQAGNFFLCVWVELVLFSILLIIDLFLNIFFCSYFSSFYFLLLNMWKFISFVLFFSSSFFSFCCCRCYYCCRRDALLKFSVYVCLLANKFVCLVLRINCVYFVYLGTHND